MPVALLFTTTLEFQNDFQTPALLFPGRALCYVPWRERALGLYWALLLFGGGAGQLVCFRGGQHVCSRQRGG